MNEPKPKPGRRQLSAVVNDITWGCAWGTGVAFVLSVFVLVVRGGAMLAGGGGTAPGLLAVVGSYFLGGLLAGAVVGVLRPVGKTAWGAGLLGFVASTPVFFVFEYFDRGPQAWSTGRVTAMLLFASLLGVPVGVIYRKLFGP